MRGRRGNVQIFNMWDDRHFDIVASFKVLTTSMIPCLGMAHCMSGNNVTLPCAGARRFHSLSVSGREEMTPPAVCRGTMPETAKSPNAP